MNNELTIDQAHTVPVSQWHPAMIKSRLKEMKDISTAEEYEERSQLEAAAMVLAEEVLEWLPGVGNMEFTDAVRNMQSDFPFLKSMVRWVDAVRLETDFRLLRKERI